MFICTIMWELRVGVFDSASLFQQDTFAAQIFNHKGAERPKFAEWP